jgi:hypothetical protein
VGNRFQVLFHSPNRGAFHLSLTVLVHYRSPRVFSLGTWSSPLPAGFLVSRGTQVGEQERAQPFAYGAFTLSGKALPRVLRLGHAPPSGLAVSPKALHLQPQHRIGKRTTQRSWFGLLPFRSPLLGESHRFLFLGVLRCFSSPACPSGSGSRPSSRLRVSSRVSPFGHPRINAR